MIRILIALAALALSTSAQALPCLGKLEKGATSYRLVNGVKCWYVGDRVPAKSEFSAPKRKEVTRKAEPPPPVKIAVLIEAAPPPAPPKMLTVRALANSRDDSIWLAAERPEVIYETLCGGPCPDFRSRIKDAFDSLTVAPFQSYPLVSLQP